MFTIKASLGGHELRVTLYGVTSSHWSSDAGELVDMAERIIKLGREFPALVV